MSEYRKRATPAMQVREVAAADMKNAWHELLDRVAQGREEIVITRYGKPVARLSPIESDESAPGLVGFLAGTVTVHGDIIAPVDEAWEAGG
jgi:prevent-host-death family protein